jgi:predicted nucleic acid-binding protein
MGKEYLMDTNVIIGYLNNDLTEAGYDLIDGIAIKISVISRIELLSWKKGTLKQLNVLEQFIINTIVLNLEEQIIVKTIDIRKLHKIKLPDAIIAATAIVNDLILLTRNVNDFKGINELKLMNPFDAG